MVGGDTDVLVHVEADHARPVDGVVEHERVEEVELRVAGGEHRVGDAASLDGATDDGRRVPRRCLAERSGIGEDAHAQRVDRGLAGHQTDANWGSHAFVAASISSVIAPSRS